MASVLKVLAPWCIVLGGLTAAGGADDIPPLPTTAPKFNKKASTPSKPAYAAKKDAKLEELRIMRGEKKEEPSTAAEGDDASGANGSDQSQGNDTDASKAARERKEKKPDTRSEEEKLGEALKKVEAEIAKLKAEGGDPKKIQTLEKRAASLRERIRNCNKKEVRERKPERRERARNVRDTRQEVRDTLRSAQPRRQ